MADYGDRGGGQSLRDALNAIMPMTGMGEYGAMFPPPTGAPQPSPSIPLPQPRPPQGLPPGAMGMPPQPGTPQGLPPRPGIQGSVPPGGDYAAQLALALPMPYLPRGGVDWGPRPPWNPTPASPPGIPRVG